ncbi:unnamed protein product [Rotaria socialis]
MQSPTTIDLSRGDVDGKNAEQLAKALQNDTTLVELDLRRNIGGIYVAIGAEIEIRNNKSLTTLQLDGNDIGDKRVYPIANRLQNNKTLRKLSLRYNEICHKGAFRLAAVLRNNTTLINPDLFGNHIEDKGMKYFAGALKNNMTLIKFDLGYNAIRDEGAYRLFFVQTLRTLNLKGNQISKIGSLHLAFGFHDNTTLMKLNLRKNMDAYLTVIGEIIQLRIDKAITDLNLSTENIGGEETLKTLYLSYIRIGDSGIQHIANAIQYNNTLNKLELLDNNIGHHGARYLTDALIHNTVVLPCHLTIFQTVTVLNLKENRIEYAGLHSLVRAVQINTTVRTTDLIDNQINDQDKTLVRLRLGGRDIMHCIGKEFDMTY